ncbi:MAG TPA: VTT domain-containing protein [Pyrinomonadaceae bacterium]|nr:VTT domain-containing protein [Acidobacteriota bacterium]HQZ96149.1 VTT domain-containing protein [Pyrinomonadaceae bacterium]
MDSIVEFLYTLKDFLNPKFLIDYMLNLLGVYVYFGLFFIIFAETGLAVGFFLPGDSLLVVSGLFAAAGKLNVLLVMLAFFLGSVIGDSTGYWTGRVMGKTLFNREESWVFKPSRVEKAHHFFEKYGPKTVILARFVPIVRTFAPIVVGAAEMPYRQFLPYSIFGGLLWIGSMVLAGYFLGGVVERALNIKLEDHIEKVVIVVVVLSLLPPIIEFLKHKFGKRPDLVDEIVEVVEDDKPAA